MALRFFFFALEISLCDCGSAPEKSKASTVVVPVSAVAAVDVAAVGGVAVSYTHLTLPTT